MRPETQPPMVSLVGAGPGDPELLTLRAARRLATADVVFVDALVDPRVLALVRKGARIVDVGKSQRAVATPQEVICALMLDEARAGHRVVRLKGGDPFVFGRGGEEALYLRARGVDIEVVPGLSSATAVAAGAGIPVTHRGLAASFTVLTGTSARGVDAGLEAAWESAAKTDGTLVFLMAMHCIERVAEVVLRAGRAPDTPACVIQNGSREDEVVLDTRLDRLAEDARVAGLASPAVIVIGAVAALRPMLAREVATLARVPKEAALDVPL